MKNSKLEIEVVEYDPRYASLEDVRRIFFTNVLQHKNGDNFTGIHLSMLLKYSRLAYAIMLAPALLTSLILYPVLSHTTTLASTTRIMFSIVMGVVASYLIFGYFMVQRLKKMYVEGGNQKLKTFTDIDEKYKKEGGNFFLALLHNQTTGQREVVGQVGFKNLKEDQTSKKVGYIEVMSVNEKYRGAGIGRKLMEKALSFAEAEKFDVVKLTVFAVNFPAVNLYKKYGFKEDKVAIEDPWTTARGIYMLKQMNHS